MYKIIMISAVIILATAWIIYGVWRIITYYSQKNKPEQKPEHLQKVKKSFDDYINKMEKFEKKTYDRK